MVGVAHEGFVERLFGLGIETLAAECDAEESMRIGVLRVDREGSLELLGRNPGPGRSHEEHGVEPVRQGSGRLVQDGPSGGADLKSAVVALVDLPGADAVELVFLAALGAGDPGGPAPVSEPVEARVVVGELVAERFDGVLHASDCI